MTRKIALCHDTFHIKGGAERMNAYMAKILGADIVSAAFKAESLDLGKMGFQGKSIAIQPDFRTGMLGFLRMKLAFYCKTGFLREYDAVIFSNEAITAVANAPKARKIYYAHSVSRHLFDQKEDYVRKVPAFLRPAIRLALVVLRAWYVRDLRRMDLILANSRKNRDFLRSLAPKTDVRILYPPVDTDEFFPSDAPDEGYFLSYARLSHAKKIDRIIDAFKRLPNERLRIIYGKNDPQKDEFTERAKGYPNITFETLEDNAALNAIVRAARAVICVSKNEDFGMIPLEAFASGVPVVAVAEGGYLETMVDGKTGILLDPEYGDEDLCRAVLAITPEYRASLRDSLLGRAAEFSLETFAEKLRSLV